MNKEQEAKFEEFDEKTVPVFSGNKKNERKWIWQACCKANGINTEEPVKDETIAAPEWVIEMMRTGRAVRCRAVNQTTNATMTINGYQLDSTYPYLGYDDSGEYDTWADVEPLPAWKPKDGEAVFAGYGNGYVVGRIERIVLDVAHVHDTNCRTFTYNIKDLKPFDASKIGKPWIEI